MQRIIQINIAGRALPIEEDAYLILKDYLSALQRQFSTEEGRDEIIQDIEYRIAELFTIRLQSGAFSIDVADVRKVMETLGAPADFGATGQASYSTTVSLPVPYTQQQRQQDYTGQQTASGQRRIYRNPNDKMLGGVCSGLGNYFDIDPVIIRLLWAASIFLAGFGVVAYLIAWAVIPVAKSPQDFAQMSDGTAMNFHDMTRNVAHEMQDLKKRGEEMSRELKEFFSKKK